MDTPQEKTPDTAWERKTLEKLLFAAYEEQKSRRRWSIFFRTAILLFLFLILLASVEFGKDADTHVRHTAMIDLQGVILPEIVEGAVGSSARSIGGASLPLFSRYLPDQNVLFKELA